MSTPAGFYQWATARGCSPYHPSAWRPEDHAAYYAWRLGLFVEKMRIFKAFGQWELMGRANTLSRIREWLDQLRAPAPSRPFLRCTCCPPDFRAKKWEPEPEHGLAYLSTFARRA